MKNLRSEVIKYAKMLNSKKLSALRSGNISIRYKDGFFITPSGAKYSSLKNKDFSVSELIDFHITSMESGRELNAFITETADIARKKAIDCDQNYLKGEEKPLEGIPLGINKQRKESHGGYVLSLIVACFYFLGIIYADNLKDQSNAQYLMWLPTSIILIFGAFLFYRLNKK